MAITDCGQAMTHKEHPLHLSVSTTMAPNILPIVLLFVRCFRLPVTGRHRRHLCHVPSGNVCLPTEKILFCQGL